MWRKHANVKILIITGLSIPPLQLEILQFTFLPLFKICWLGLVVGEASHRRTSVGPPNSSPSRLPSNYTPPDNSSAFIPLWNPSHRSSLCVGALPARQCLRVKSGGQNLRLLFLWWFKYLHQVTLLQGGLSMSNVQVQKIALTFREFLKKRFSMVRLAIRVDPILSV